MNDILLSSNELAQQRTEMGFERTVMALERTLMAWIRTSLSMISFGFTIYKFLEAIERNTEISMRQSAPRNLGLFLIVLGMGVLGMAIFQFNRAAKTVQQYSAIKPPISIALIAAVGILIVGLFTILNIIFGLGGF